MHIHSVQDYILISSGVVTLCQDFLNDHKINNIEQYNKYQWRRLIKQIINDKNRNDVLSMMRKYKKVDYDKCLDEKYEMKDFFKTMTVADSRMAFKILNFVVPTIRLNFKSDKKFKYEG